MHNIKSALAIGISLEEHRRELIRAQQDVDRAKRKAPFAAEPEFWDAIDRAMQDYSRASDHWQEQIRASVDEDTVREQSLEREMQAAWSSASRWILDAAYRIDLPYGQPREDHDH